MSSKAGTTSSAAQGASTQAIADLARTYEEAKAKLATANKTWKAAQKARRNAKKALKKAQDALEKADRVSHQECQTTFTHVSTISSAKDSANASSSRSSDSSSDEVTDSESKFKTDSELLGAEGEAAIDKASARATVKSTSLQPKDEWIDTKGKENEEGWQTVDESETRSKPKTKKSKKIKEETKKEGLTQSQRRRSLDEYGDLMDAEDREYEEILAGRHPYPYDSDEDIDSNEDTDSDEDVDPDEDLSDGFDMPELFMGDPRDRDVADIMGMNPYDDSFW
jgi:predicted RNA-binding protein with PUA-like domain/exonuclease VII small subunit